MDSIIGKWQQSEGQPFAGLYFEFKPDGNFSAHYDSMGISSSGTYTAENGVIDLDQTSHTFGLIGKFLGLYVIEGNTLVMTLSDQGNIRPEVLEGKNKRTYVRVNQ